MTGFRPWFQSLPIHRKLVVTSLIKTTSVLVLAMLSLLIVDTWRFERAARADAAALATIVAENVRAGMAFEDREAVQAGVDLIRIRPQVERVCVYDLQSRLFVHYVRVGLEPCSPSLPGAQSWRVLHAIKPVEHEGQTLGRIFLVRDWQFIVDRLIAAAWTSLAVLIVAGGVLFVLSHRLHRHISEPIRQLAQAAGEMGQTGHYKMPPIPASQDEVGQLVRAFGSMVERVETVTNDLKRTNDALRSEIEERQVIEKEREALLRREQETNRLKNEFLATVSHELRTPLNAIVGWTHVLSTTTPDAATIAKATASLHRNALAQARVIDDLIDISRIVTGKLRVDPTPLDLRKAVEAAVEAIRSTATHAGISLTVDLPDDTCVIMGDNDRLQQVVWNLLSNAVKFAPRGHVGVSLDRLSNQVQLTVWDDGIGIAPEFLPHVFDRFRQADSSVTRERGGLGIGLAVVKELVDLHGGAIRAESAGRGTGARFIITFPCIEQEVTEDRGDERLPRLDGISILAVDDNADSLEVLREVLARSGASVRTATSGLQALDEWQRQAADVLICDIAMPHMSGYQVLARVRDLDRAAGRVTPAIALTAHATDEQVARSAQAGFQLHVAKPFNGVQLIRAINTARSRV